MQIVSLHSSAMCPCSPPSLLFLRVFDLSFFFVSAVFLLGQIKSLEREEKKYHAAGVKCIKLSLVFSCVISSSSPFFARCNLILPVVQLPILVSRVVNDLLVSFDYTDTFFFFSLLSRLNLISIHTALELLFSLSFSLYSHRRHSVSLVKH